MLLYSLLHLTGVKAVSKDYETLGEPSVPLEAIKKFRQLDSRCPGHPEYRWTSGVETTTGPLGQGLANSAGMAIAGRWRAPTAGVRGPVDLTSTPCARRLTSSRPRRRRWPATWARTLWIYDNNHITIEGNTALAFSDDVATRFIGHGWNVTRVGDANDLEMLERAFRTFKSTSDRPTLIIVDSPHTARQTAGYERGARRAAGRGESGWQSVIIAGRRKFLVGWCVSIFRWASGRAALFRAGRLG
jgi:transketolase